MGVGIRLPAHAPQKDAMKQRSKRYRAFEEKKPTQPVSAQEAIDLLRTYPAKGDVTLEVHFNLGVDPKKAEHLIRGSSSLPHGTGKKIRVAAFVPEALVKDALAAGAAVAGGEQFITELKTSQKIDFDVAVAHPEMMRAMAVVAKLLGTRGLMPSAKTDTITTDPISAIKKLQGGKVNFRMDESGNVHQAIGRFSFTTEQLLENLTTMIETIQKLRPTGIKGAYLRSVTLSTSQSPSIAIEVA